MGKLHELLAVESTVTEASKKLIEETRNKFGKPENYYSGHIKTLHMLNASPENTAAEEAARQEKAMPSTVVDTLEYLFQFWGKAEDVLYQKNVTNTRAVANIEFRGEVLAEGVPVDELMGLEKRLADLRGLLSIMPSQDASKVWEADLGRGRYVYKARVPDVVSKTEKQIDAKVLYEATKEHPAQVKEYTKDVTVGTFTTQHWTGTVSAIQKSDALAVIDDLVAEVKKSRNRANMVEAIPGTIASKLISVIMQPLKVA